MGFCKDFIWGAATASYQVEGAAFEDGRGLSVWDSFCEIPGKVYQEHSGTVACDQYHLYKEDIRFMKELGIQAYRFSISWSRIFPEGTGSINEKGVAYYDSLVNELLANDIIPYITLFHWDFPLALQQKGGWLNEDCIQWFSDYAAFISAHFSDRVKDYITLNEPQCFIGLGYLEGTHAPGWKINEREYFQIVHNVLRAHGAAVIQLRAFAKSDIRIGYAPTGNGYYPSTGSDEDTRAARHMTFTCPDDVHALNWCVSWMSDPVMLGHYPKEVLERFQGRLPKITEEDMKLISQPIDFYAQNIYQGTEVRAGTDGKPMIVKRYDGFPRTSINWPVTPEILRWEPQFLFERYKKPIVITENGMAAHDAVSLDGKVHDANRIDFYHRYLKALKECAASGTDIRGYFAWSLLDNFEWAEGYNERFGLVYVDYRNQQRIIKDSGYWYRQQIVSNGEAL